MENIMLTEDEIVNEVAKVLDRIITENFKSLSEGNFLIRPGFGFKFYLDRVSSRFGYDLYSLIHYILIETKISHKIYNKIQLGQCLYVKYNEPGGFYLPNPSGEEYELNEMLGFVFFRCTIFVAHRLVSLGLDVSKDYDEQLEEIDYKIVDGLKS
jgi:hypothetical protein